MTRYLNRAAALLAHYTEAGGAPYIGEAVSQAQHAAQTAWLAERAGAAPEVVLAALLHDIGHLLAGPGIEPAGDLGVPDHEAVGARFLEGQGLSPRLCALVRGHVRAKRYLAGKHDNYLQKLSAASRATLALQGGPMGAAERAAFEADPRRTDWLALRAWDDAAKDPAAAVPPLEHWLPALAEHLEKQALAITSGPSTEQVQQFQTQGWVHLPARLDPNGRARLAAWVEALATWPELPGRWMMYFETAADGSRRLCRMEDLLPWHAGIAEFVAGTSLIECVAALVGEPVRLFKEKINLKLPGGAGFAAHQDAPAFARHGSDHVTVMVAVDDATPANGCLEVAEHPGVGVTLPAGEDLALTPAAAAGLVWRALPVAAGDLLVFDAWLPHRSGVNGTRAPRRALYLTYNPTRAGDHRAAYFERKRAAFPPEIERQPGRRYEAPEFNVGNPIR